MQDGFARGVFYEAVDEECEQDQDCVGDPGVESGNVQALWNAIEMEQDVDVEVKQVETVTALADEQDRLPREDG